MRRREPPATGGGGGEAHRGRTRWGRGGEREEDDGACINVSFLLTHWKFSYYHLSCALYKIRFHFDL